MTRSRVPGRSFFIWSGGTRDVERAGFEQALHGIAEDLRAEVVDIGFDHGDGGRFGAVFGFAEQDAQHVGVVREIVVAGAVADARDPHGRHHAEGLAPVWSTTAAPVGVVSSTAGPRRRPAFGQQARGGGRGHGQHAVLGLDGAAADVDGRADDGGDAQLVEGHAGADDVGDGIGRADFVEVDLLDGNLVDGGFGLAQTLEHGGGVLFDAIGQSRLVDHLQDVREMAVRLLVVHLDVKLGGADAAALDLLERDAWRRWRASEWRRRWRSGRRRRRPARRPACRR